MQLHEELSDQGLKVITLNMEGKEIVPQAESVAKKLKLQLTNLCVDEGMSDEVLDFLDRPDGLLPAVNVYDYRGRLLHKLEGEFTHEDLKQAVDSALAGEVL